MDAIYTSNHRENFEPYSGKVEDVSYGPGETQRHQKVEDAANGALDPWGAKHRAAQVTGRRLRNS